jgi:hypothetical protein
LSNLEGRLLAACLLPSFTLFLGDDVKSGNPTQWRYSHGEDA